MALERYTGDKAAKTAQVTAPGQTVVLTPNPGRALTVYWVSAINDPDSEFQPRIRVGFAGESDFFYSAYALAHWERFEGDHDQSVVVELDQAGDVAVTIHYKESR